MDIDKRVNEFKTLSDADKVIAFKLALIICDTHEQVEDRYRSLIEQYERMEKTYKSFINKHYPELHLL